MFIVKKILITSFRSSKFLFFFEAFTRTKTKSTTFEKNTKLSKCELIKLSTSFFFHFRRFNSLLDFFFQFQIFDFQNKIVSRFCTIFINQQHIYISLKKMRVFFQDLNDFQRYHFENFVKIKRKRFLSIILLMYIASIKNKVVVVVVFFRSTLVVFVTFKSAIVVIFHVHNHDSSMICFHCDEFDHVKINCFNLNKFVVFRIREIIDELNENIKKIFDQIDETKNV